METKSKLIQWLKEICLIKQGVSNLEGKLPKICSNGVIFSDILNRVNFSYFYLFLK